MLANNSLLSLSTSAPPQIFLFASLLFGNGRTFLSTPNAIIDKIKHNLAPTYSTMSVHENKDSVVPKTVPSPLSMKNNNSK